METRYIGYIDPVLK